MTIQFSYSSIKTYDQCPKKYYHTRVKRDVEDVSGEAADYGTAVHTAAEEFTKNGTPIPKKFAYMGPIMEAVAAIPGEHHAELQLGVRKKIDGRYVPCGFNDNKRWWRGIIDFLAVDGHTAYMLDYKTGKSARYADPKQLDLMAGAIFVHFPEVMKIKSSLAFVVSGEWVPKEHLRTEMNQYLSVFDRQLRQLAVSMDKNVWNPKPSGLCGWCPCTDCSHWFGRRR